MQLMTMASNHHESQGSGYGQQHWMGMGGYPNTTQPSPASMHDYHQAEYYIPPAMPMEPSYSMPRPPPPYSSSHALPPPPLIMPHNTLWPSMLLNQSNYQTPILPAAPVQTPVSATTTHSDMTPTSAKSTTSRRKLTDEERRQMCVEAQQNPGIKQTQIGVKFNVERSTVSKILRQKDKYLYPTPKEESTSPVKKSKVKFPDVERALVNWVRNEQKKGVSITDEKLKKQARFFATTSPSTESQAQITSSAWLENFKRKNNLHIGARKGKASVSVNTDDAALVDSSTTSLSETLLDDSPTSSGFVSPPISPEEDGSRSIVKGESSHDFFDYVGKDQYDDSVSLENALSNELDSSNSIMSPVSPELIRANSASTIENLPAFASNFNRQRAQTFPSELDTDSLSRPTSSGRATPAVPIRSMSTMIDTRQTSVNPLHTVKRHKSVSDIHETEVIHYSSMRPPPLPKSVENSPTSPGSPTPEEARQALHVLKHFFQAQQTDVVDEDDYIMIGKLMGKLKQLKLMRRPTDSDMLPGGMHQLEVYDSPRMSKKRTFAALGIST